MAGVRKVEVLREAIESARNANETHILDLRELLELKLRIANAFQDSQITEAEREELMTLITPQQALNHFTRI